VSMTTIVVLSVIVGWLGTLVLQADVNRVSLVDFIIAIGGAALAARLLAPFLRIPIAAADSGLTLPGTALVFLGAITLLAAANLVRHGRVR
jgi:uncharacterized membrane protein YeaQ/YmgE (transglycosylase-associated protein family)